MYISLQNCGKNYHRTWLFRGLSFNIELGAEGYNSNPLRLAILGSNGAGKSTLFKAIMGFVPVARGEIRLLGMTVKEALRRNLVAYVPQAEEVDWSFPILVEDVVMLGRYGHMGFLRRPSAADHAAVDQALARVVGRELAHRRALRPACGRG